VKSLIVLGGLKLLKISQLSSHCFDCQILNLPNFKNSEISDLIQLFMKSCSNLTDFFVTLFYFFSIIQQMNCNDNFGRQHLPKRRKRKSPVIDSQSFKEN
jgi:hypothetical protein